MGIEDLDRSSGRLKLNKNAIISFSNSSTFLIIYNLKLLLIDVFHPYISDKFFKNLLQILQKFQSSMLGSV